MLLLLALVSTSTLTLEEARRRYVAETPEEIRTAHDPLWGERPAGPSILARAPTAEDDLIRDIKAGSAFHAWGAPLVLTGVSELIAGIIILAVEIKDETTKIPGIATIGTGIVFTVVGGLLYSAGSRRFDKHISDP